MPRKRGGWKCCNFESGDGSRFGIEVSCRHLEQPVGGELLIWPEIRREMSRLVILGEAARISRCAT